MQVKGSIRPRILGVVLATVLLASAVGCGHRTGSPGGAAPRGGEGAASAPVVVNPEQIASFYRGKTVTIIVGFSPGGGFDTTALILGRHLGNHIPGNPAIIVENMDGAGSLIAANHIYSFAKPDGLTLATFNEVQVINQVTNMDGVQFDARKYGWLGNVQQASTTCTIRSDTPYNAPPDLKRKDLPTINLGGTAAGSATDDVAKLLEQVVGANVKLVSGYPGTSQIRLAVESREVDGLCWTWDSVRATAQNWLDTNYIKVLVYQATERDPRVEERFPQAIRIEDLVD